MSAHVTRPKLMPVSADPAIRSVARLAVRAKAVLQGKAPVPRSKAMFGKDDLVDNLSRDLDRARGRRDALASEATTLTAQIAEIEARLSEEKKRRERERVLSEVEAIKTRIKQAAGAFAPVVDGLSRAVEQAAAVVPEARELNSVGGDRDRQRARSPAPRTGSARGCGANWTGSAGPAEFGH